MEFRGNRVQQFRKRGDARVGPCEFLRFIAIFFAACRAGTVRTEIDRGVVQRLHALFVLLRMPRAGLLDFVRLFEFAQLARAVFLHHFESGGGDAGIVDQAHFRGPRRVARQLRVCLVFPALHITAAHGEAGVDAFEHLVPFGVVHHLAAAFDLLALVVEGDALELARRHAAVHRAQIADASAVARLGDLRRPGLELGPRRLVVHDLVRAIGNLLGDRAEDETLLDIDLGERNKQMEFHGCDSFVRFEKRKA